MGENRGWWKRNLGHVPKPAIAMLAAFALFWSLVIVDALFFPEEQAPKRAAKTTTEQTAPAETRSATTPKPKASKPRSTAPKSTPSAPKPEPKPRPVPKPRRATESDPAAKAQRFYLAVDDAAIALDDAIGRALNRSHGASTQIAAAKRRISARLNAHLLDGGETSVGANLLLSAATQAQEAIRREDLARLADARREVTGARRKLATELR